MSTLFASTLFAMFFPGNMEWIIIGVVMLLLFGHRLPGLMRSLGKGVVEFKRGVQGIEDIEDEVEQAVNADQKSDVS